MESNFPVTFIETLKVSLWYPTTCVQCRGHFLNSQSKFFSPHGPCLTHSGLTAGGYSESVVEHSVGH